MKTDKKYRVNESEHFNLMSMYDHLKVMQMNMDEGIIPYDETIDDHITEIEDLLDKAPCVGAAVSWEDLKRIREIKEERQMIRYTKSLEAGINEKDAAMAFDL